MKTKNASIFDALAVETKGIVLEEGVIELPEGLVEDEIELALYQEAHPSVSIFVNEKKANTFGWGDKVQLKTPSCTTTLSFALEEGEGRFFGHIFKANRSGQPKSEDRFEAYDWKICLRTLKRHTRCRIKVFVEYRLLA